MGSAKSDDDERLLARLNALKPSPIQLGLRSSVNSSSVEEGTDGDSNDLIARFQLLYGKRGHRPKEESTGIQDEIAHQGPPSPTVEELLAELNANESYKINKSDEVEARDSMVGARKALSTMRETSANRFPVEDKLRPESPPTAAVDTEADDGTVTDAEAEAALQQILDEAEDDMEVEQPQKEIIRSDGTEHLPSQVQNPIDSFSQIRFPTPPGDDLQTVQLPSAPSEVPSSRRRLVKSQSTKFSDEEINTWCTICCANAAVQCFGCDKDLYCWSCWRGGHMGPDAGFDERTHVWERYKNPTK